MKSLYMFIVFIIIIARIKNEKKFLKKSISKILKENTNININDKLKINSFKNLSEKARQKFNFRYENIIKNFDRFLLKNSDDLKSCENNKLLFENICQKENFKNNNIFLNSYFYPNNTQYENFLLFFKENSKSDIGTVEKYDSLFDIFLRGSGQKMDEKENKILQLNKIFNNIGIHDKIYIFSQKNDNLTENDIILKIDFTGPESFGENKENLLKIKLKNQEIGFKCKSLYFQFSSFPLMEINKVTKNELKIINYPAQMSILLESSDKEDDKKYLILNLNFSRKKDDVGLENLKNKDLKIEFEYDLIKYLVEDLNKIMDANVTHIKDFSEKNIKLNINSKENKYNDYSKLNEKASNLKNLIIKNYNYSDNFGDVFFESLENSIDFINEKDKNFESAKNKSLSYGLDLSTIFNYLKSPNTVFDFSSIENSDDKCTLFYTIDIIKDIPVSNSKYISLSNLLNVIISKKKIANLRKNYISKGNIFNNIIFIEKHKNHLKKKSNEIDVNQSRLLSLFVSKKLSKIKFNDSQNVQKLNFSDWKISKPSLLDNQAFNIQNDIMEYDDNFSSLINSKIIKRSSKLDEIINLFDEFLMLITNNSTKITKNINLRDDTLDDYLENEEEKEENDDQEWKKLEEEFRDDGSENHEEKHNKKKKKHKKKKHHKLHNQTHNDSITNEIKKEENNTTFVADAAAKNKEDYSTKNEKNHENKIPEKSQKEDNINVKEKKEKKENSEENKEKKKKHKKNKHSKHSKNHTRINKNHSSHDTKDIIHNGHDEINEDKKIIFSNLDFTNIQNKTKPEFSDLNGKKEKEKTNFKNLLMFINIIKILPVESTNFKPNEKCFKNSTQISTKNNTIKAKIIEDQPNKKISSEIDKLSKVSSNVQNKTEEKPIFVPINDTNLSSVIDLDEKSNITLSEEALDNQILKLLNDTDGKVETQTKIKNITETSQSNENINHYNININISKPPIKQNQKKTDISLDADKAEKKISFISPNSNINNTNEDEFGNIQDYVKNATHTNIPKISRKQNLKIFGGNIYFDETIIFGDRND